MILDNMYLNSIKYDSDNPLMDKVKDLLRTPILKLYQDNNVTKFYNELLLLSNCWGLGDNVSVETVYEEFTPEYIFTIKIPKHFSKHDENEIFMKLNFQMEHFCKSNDMLDFLREAYIIFE